MEGAELANTQTREAYPIAVDNFGLTSLDELVGDLIVYRNLEPITRQLPGLKSARHQLGLPAPSVPRKQETSYAQVALWILEQAQERRKRLCRRAAFHRRYALRRWEYVPGDAFLALCGRVAAR